MTTEEDFKRMQAEVTGAAEYSKGKRVANRNLNGKNKNMGRPQNKPKKPKVY